MANAPTSREKTEHVGTDDVEMTPPGEKRKAHEQLDSDICDRVNNMEVSDALDTSGIAGIFPEDGDLGGIADATHRGEITGAPIDPEAVEDACTHELKYYRKRDACDTVSLGR